MESQVKMIRDQLVNQPFEDVYTFYFSQKEMTKELLDIFVDSFDTNNLDTSDINSINISTFKDWVVYEYEINEELIYFPHFIDYYLLCHYREDGLKIYAIKRKASFLVLGFIPDDDEDVDYEYFIKEYEEKLINKKWWSDYEAKVWEDLQNKRRKVQEFEIYIYNLESDIFNAWSEDKEIFHANYTTIYLKHIDRIKFEISRIKLFKGDLLKIPMLENLIEYITELRNEDEFYYNLIKKSFKKGDNEEFGYIPINLEDQEKFVYCSKLGIIEYLKEKIKDSGIKYTDSKLYPFITLITGINNGTVKKWMSFHNNPNNISEENLFKDLKLMERVDRFLVNTNMIKNGE